MAKLHNAAGSVLAGLTGRREPDIYSAKTISDLFAVHKGEVASAHWKEVVKDFDMAIRNVQAGDGNWKEETVKELLPGRDYALRKLSEAQSTKSSTEFDTGKHAVSPAVGESIVADPEAVIAANTNGDGTEVASLGESPRARDVTYPGIN